MTLDEAIKHARDKANEQKYCKKQTECRECEMRISGGCMIGFDIKGSDLDKLFED